MVEKVIIVGAAGRDFHNFNVYFRDNPRYQVIAITAAQIPNIEDRTYPSVLAGSLYPRGIPILREEEMARLIRDHRVDLVAFSYSDVSHVDLMHKASIAMAEGADFILLGATYTMLKAKRPVIAVCAVRTGCGKSQTTRKICEILRGISKRVVVVRHPMPYGDLIRQAVQRFCCFEDFERNQCTIEEREEYEPLVEQGIIVYGGIDYARVLEQAEAEADVIVWDGGNNDTPFFHPDVHIVLFDPHRAGHERLYYPGETNMLMADIAIVNKVDTASSTDIETVLDNIQRHAPKAEIVLAQSPVSVDHPERVSGRRVLVVEDGPTLTHGGMALGAATIAARKFGASAIVDPRPFAVGSIRDAFEAYPHLGVQLPAVGYSDSQRRDLERTIQGIDCDLVLIATPVNLGAIIQISQPSMRVRYEYKDYGTPTLEDILMRWAHKLRIQPAP
jgi:predicted GTPase